MNKNNCLICQNIKNIKKQFIICDLCQKNYALFSKSFCINELLLSKSDLEELNYFLKGTTKLFLEDDIQILIKKKYGDINNYNTYKQNKLSTKMQRLNLQQKIREERKNELINRLSEYKLEYKTYGDCYTHVQYGYPEINTIIENELEKYKKIFSKKQEIINTCNELNEEIGSKHYKYIHGITKDFNNSDEFNNHNNDHMILFD